MTDVLRPGGNILYMKVGIHAQETLEDIIARKTREIDEAGYAFWGYGGNTCHPTTKVQPFVQRGVEHGSDLFVYGENELKTLCRAD
jgi:hypothetical protein